MGGCSRKLKQFLNVHISKNIIKVKIHILNGHVYLLFVQITL